MFGMSTHEKFQAAIKKGDLNAVKKILRNHSHYADTQFYAHGSALYPLHLAARLNHADIVEWMVREGHSSLDQTCYSGRTALHFACAHDAYETAERLLKLGAEARKEDWNGNTPYSFCEAGSRTLSLFQSYIDEEQRLEREKAAAKEARRLEKARLAQEAKRQSAEFLRAVVEGNVEAVRKALEENPKLLEAKFEWPKDMEGTAMQAAAFHNQPAVITFLAKEKRVSLHECGEDGNTPLHYACTGGATEAVQTLLQLGAYAFTPNKKGRIPADVRSNAAIKDIFTPLIEERDRKAQEDKEAREWSLVSPAEIMRVRNLPDDSYRLTDIFNFSTRRWTSLAKDIKNGHVALNNAFFDDIPDKEILQQAHRHLVRLKGKADPESIERRPMDKPHPGKI